MKRQPNDIQPFERIAYWMNWFDQSFKKNLSVDFLQDFNKRPYRATEGKIDKEKPPT